MISRPTTKAIRGAATALTLLLASGAGAQEPATAESPAAESRSAESRSAEAAPVSSPIPTAAEAAAAMNALGARLLSQNLAREGTAGQLVSPLSLGAALLMTAQGAEGATATAFAEAFGVAGKPELAALAPAAGSLLRELREEESGAIFGTANALWVAPDLTLREAFAERQRRDLDAAVETMDFADPGALERVNGWFAEATGGMIDPMLSELPADTRALLANALHFKASWQTPFDAAATVRGAFGLLGGGTAEAAFMQREGELRHRETEDGLQAAVLGFEGGSFEMLLLLPPEDADARLWGADLSPEDWAALLDPQAYQRRSGRLELPRVSLRTGGEVTGQLSALGLGAAFRPGADFSGIAEEPLMLEQVVHRTALDWDETGAEAAAATAVTMTRSSLAEPKPFVMVLDRPFYAVLRHAESGAVLLQGLVVAPGAAAAGAPPRSEAE